MTTNESISEEAALVEVVDDDDEIDSITASQHHENSEENNVDDDGAPYSSQAKMKRKSQSNVFSGGGGGGGERRRSSLVSNRTRRPSLGTTMDTMVRLYANHEELAGRRDSLSMILPALESKRRRPSNVGLLQIHYEEKIDPTLGMTTGGEYDDMYGDAYGEYDDEEMPAAERELAEDAAWKLIQKNTFTRWANEHLKTVNRRIDDLEFDLSDGLNLVYLVEILSGKKFKYVNKRPGFRTQKLENVTMVLEFLENEEKIKIINIDSTDIVDCKLKLILGLIWTLILHYAISMPMWEGEDFADKSDTPKQRLMKWIQSKIPDLGIKNFTTDWNDGRAIGALVDACQPGLCPDWIDFDRVNAVQNCKQAMDAAEEWMEIPQLIRPEEMANPRVDEMSMMTYLSQYPNAKLKQGAPLKPRTNANRVNAYGPGIEPQGNHVGAPARFTVETFNAGLGDIEVLVVNPQGQREPCDIHFNQDANLTYSCCYVPQMEGPYKVYIKFAGKEIPRSPYHVNVKGAPGDARKCHASGPGIEPVGNMAGKKTWFDVSVKDAGSGNIDVLILDPHGNKDVIRPAVSKRDPNTYHVEYLPREPGPHVIHVYFAGNPIPDSPFTVHVAPPCEAKRAYATGRGIQSRGIRVNDVAEFKVHTEAAGEGNLDVQVIGPGGRQVNCSVEKVSPHLYRCIYHPTVAGPYCVNVTYGNGHIQKSPFKVDVGPFKESAIRAFGPGLEGGTCGYPADFTVETNGETGALGFAIEGPSQAKIDCHDNGDGSADITYWPTAPGEYAVHILCNDEDIPKSPYMAQIKPATTEYDPRKVTAAGPGLNRTGVTVGNYADFLVDARKGGHGELRITCMDEEYNPVDVQVRDNHDGTFSCRYLPKAENKHTVIIAWSGCNIPKSPFRVYVSEPSDPSKVRVYGPGVERGVKTFEPTYFVVDCKNAGPGDVAIALTNERGLDVPVQTTDNGDSTFTIHYEPRTVGTYTASVFFADKEIPTSPIRIQVDPNIDISKVLVNGLESSYPIGQEVNFDIDTRGALPPSQAGHAQPTVTIVSPTGRRILAGLEETPSGYTTRFIPFEEGPHSVNVTVGGLQVPGLPRKFTAVKPAPPPMPPPPPPPVTDPAKVKVYGPGIEGGVANVPAEFTVDTRQAGPGSLGLLIEGPSQAKINCHDNGDGTCRVVYYPTEPGDYNVTVTYADRPVPNSPFRVKISPERKVDVRGIRVYGPGIEPGVFCDSTTEFTVDARAVNKTGDGKVKVLINNPSGSKSMGIVTNNNDGTYRVQYTPFEVGQHLVNVTYEGLTVPSSPFAVQVTAGSDPTKVRAYGPGLKGGYSHQPQVFTIETKGAGKGSISLAIEGPSEAMMQCKDNRDGSCTVEYLPTKAGNYEISVKYADQHVPGSPFRVPIQDIVDPRKVRAYGPGLDPRGVKTNEPSNFIVDASEAGEANLEVFFTDASGKRLPAQVLNNGDGTHQVTYFATMEGRCAIEVKYAGQNIPHSPYIVEAKPSYDPSRVIISGEGLSATGVLASFPTSFLIDTRHAGVANLDVIIQDPQGNYVTPIIRDNGDGTYLVTYTPEDIGVYTVRIRFGGQDVPGSPVYVQAHTTGDASKCFISEGNDQYILLGDTCVITVNAVQAGHGNVTCRIRSPQGGDCDIDIADNGDGTFSIHYTPRIQGSYTLTIKFGGNLIPNGHFVQEASSQAELRTVRLQQSSQLLTQYSTHQASHSATYSATHSASSSHSYYPQEFCLPAGPVFNFVESYVVMPSGNVAAPEITDNKDGTVTIKYHPTEAGLHELHVKYNNDGIEGSPFRFHVDHVASGNVTAYGPGLSHAMSSDQAKFTIVTKDAGSGGLSVSIEGPSKADIQCKDNKDGTCSVTYTPIVSGEYQISIKFKGTHIKGSPFTAKVSSEGRKKSHLSIGSSSEISLKVTEADISNLTAVIKTPTGKDEPCLLKRLANGHLGISFTPKEKGDHKVSVTRYNEQIKGSPFTVSISDKEVGNAKKVKTSGKALQEGMAGVLNEFLVDTAEAGYGGLSLSIEGPSKADINCQEAGNGKCNVTYKPSEPGTYIINVKYADEHVTGSPFLIKVGGTATGRQVETFKKDRVKENDAQVGQGCELLLKVPGASPFDMEASVTNPSGVTELCEVHDRDSSHFAIRFTPQETGMHAVGIKHKGQHIPGSPFQFTVGQIQGGGAYKVRAGGPGLVKGEINLPQEFDIYTREAGAGTLSIAIEGPAKANIKFEDRKNGTCGVIWSAAEVGDYMVAVKFNEEHIPDSPFRVSIGPQSGEAKLVTVHSLQMQGLTIGKAYTFSARLNGAKGRLAAFTTLPNGQEEDCWVQEVNDGEYAVRMTPNANGNYYVHVTFNGHDIPGSPFRCAVGKVDADPGKVTAYGEGLVEGKTGEVAKFIVNTCNAGAATLSVVVDGPSKVQLNCKEVDEGYKFYWTPTAAGDYMVTIKYQGSTHIIGSPFKVHVSGTGKGSGFNEQASLNIETVAKSSTTTTKKSGQPKLSSNASKCTAKGNGLNKAFVNKKAMFTVDVKGAGENAVFVGVVGPNGAGPVDELNIKHTARTVYTVSYTMKERGEFFLLVKYGDEHIPGSPFTLEVA